MVDEGTDFKVNADVRLRIGEAQDSEEQKKESKVSRKKAPVPWCTLPYYYCFRSKDSRCFNNYKVQYLSEAL